MNIALVLHLYQPITQDREFFNSLYSSFYFPFLKFIKSKKDFYVTLNTPLSLLEQMDKYGHTEWIDLLKELVSSEKVEITGTAAYHPLLTRLPEDLIESEIILNEYSLGYYLGRRTGFEGEPSIMVKDLNGFFPPELAQNSSLIKSLDSLGYKWVVSDSLFMPKGHGVYEIDGLDIKLVVRNRELSNALAFRRDTEIKDFTNMINNDSVLALDGETFGHHNKEGMYLLENFIDYVLSHEGHFLTVTPFINKSSCYTLKNISEVKESTWGSTTEEANLGIIYPMWDDKGNKLQQALWNLQKSFIDVRNLLAPFNEITDNETTPVWKTYPDESIKDMILLLQSFSSDQFWWASHKVMPDGVVLYDPSMVMKSIKLYGELISDAKKDDKGIKESTINQLEEAVDSAKTLLESSETSIY